MRKIHITEEQLNAIKKSIEEEYSVDATQKLSDNGNNAKTAAQELQAENPTLASDLKTGKATMTYNPASKATSCPSSCILFITQTVLAHSGCDNKMS